MKQAEASLRRHFRRAGFRLLKYPGEGPDLLLRKGGKLFAVELKAVRPYRAPDLRGRVAEAVLQLAKFRREKPSAKPVVGVLLERITPSALRELEGFLDEYADGVDWIAWDSAGASKWRIDGARGGRPGSNAIERKVARVFDPFSPKSEWALKVLLLSGMDARYFGQSFEQPPSSIQQLHRMSGISQSHAWNLVDNLRRLEYLAAIPDLRFRDPMRLIEDWARSHRARVSATATLAKPLFKVENRSTFYERLARAKSASGRNLIVGSFEGCRRLGISRTNVEYMRVYADEGAPKLMRLLDLAPADPTDAWVELAHPKEFPGASAGSVLVGDVRVTDVLQCFLDVRFHPARGMEQSDFILEAIFRPHFARRGWG